MDVDELGFSEHDLAVLGHFESLQAELDPLDEEADIFDWGQWG